MPNWSSSSGERPAGTKMREAPGARVEPQADATPRRRAPDAAQLA